MIWNNYKLLTKQQIKQKMSFFLKKNWFPVALIFLVVLGLLKRYYKNSSSFGGPKTSLITEAPSSGASSTMSVLEVSPADGLPNLSPETQLAFLKRFGEVAKQEMKKYGIPASVILSTAYVNSHGGTRAVVAQSNNFFAIPCGVDKGIGAVQHNGTCHAKFKTAWESYRTFSIHISSQDWAAKLRASHAGYEAWVKAIAKNGHSDVPDYENEARKIIHQYRLWELDQ